MHPIISRLIAMSTLKQDATRRQEAARNIELILGHGEMAALQRFAEEHKQKMAQLRECERNFYSEVSGLAWHLEQNPEYY